jgi:DNA-binding FadR family transcriptional regulator
MDGLFMVNRPLSTQLTDRLASMILNEGVYSPGSQLPTERELSEILGASRTSIREATKQLEARGILVIKRGVGTFVSDNPGVTRDPLGVDNESDIISVLEDWYSVRMILEGEAMELVAKNATDEELKQIREIMEAEVSLANTQDQDFMNEDQNFHCSLARATHNIIMERLIPSLHASVYYDMVKSLYDQLRHRYNRNAINNHERIMLHLEQRDSRGANLAMRYHMLTAIEDVRSLR